jgi:large conductance mechanosensitive channel
VPAGDVSTLEKARAAGANVLAYGHLIQTVVDFLIIALCIFLVLKVLTAMHRKKEAAAAAAPPSQTEVLLTEIRDSLRGGR